jgi:hypothetical protein
MAICILTITSYCFFETALWLYYAEYEDKSQFPRLAVLDPSSSCLYNVFTLAKRTSKKLNFRTTKEETQKATQLDWLFNFSVQEIFLYYSCG